MKLKQIIFALVAILSSFSVSAWAQATVTTAAELKEALANGGEVTLGTDITVDETQTIPAGVSVTLDLNGKTVSQSKACVASYEMILNKGNLTIKNGTIRFTDTSEGDPTFGWGSYTVRNEGTLVVDGATIEHLGKQAFATHMICAIFQYSGSTIINGGKISTPNYRSIRLWKGDMTINGGTFDGQVWVQAVDNSAKLTINAGTFEPNGNDASSVFVGNEKYDVEFAVAGGTFNGKIGCSDATKLAGAISGGKFNEGAKSGTNSALLASGFIFGEAGTDGYYAVEDAPATHYIATLEDLKALRDAVNSGTNYYAGVNVYLTADIDLAGENWVGIGSATAEHGFMGNFDGKGYTIKNLTITEPALDSYGYAYAGLFAVTEGADKDNQNTIKNLTIENVTINTTGHIVSAAIAYPYYTIVDNIQVCGDIKIQGGNYTAGVLAYTRRCVNASNLSIVGEEGSFVTGNQTVGGVISDIQMNGGLTAVYKNFSAQYLSISGTKQVGGISGIISQQTLDGATVKKVALNCSDARVGIVTGCLGGISTISNVTYENVTGATATIGATYDDAKAVEARIDNMYYATFADAYAAAKEGETVSMLADLNMSEILVLDKAITLDGNGKTLTSTSTAGRAINVSGADGVTIKNLTINASGERAINIIQNATNVTIDNVTATAANYTVNVASSAPKAVVTIKNSTLNGLCTVNVSAAGANVTVDNSTVNCNDNNTTAGESYAALSLNKEAVGGSIVATSTTVNVAAGSDSMKGRNGAENGTVSINGSTDDVTVMVAAITYPGSDNYHAFATLKAAIEFAKADDVVTLIRNITASDIITINKAITLDGNGKTLTSTAGRAINVDTDGNVVIKNFAIDAKGERGINVINKAVDLTLNSVDVTADFYAVNLAATAANTKVAINRGSLTSKLMPLNVWTANAAITLDGVILNSTAEADNETYAAIQLNKGAEGTTVKAKKCTLKVTDPDSPATSNWTTTGEIVLDGTTGEQTTIVATIGAAGYTTLAKAIEAAKAGETIVLLRDMTVAEKITISASVVIDGNGKTITYTGSDRAIDVPANADAKVNVTIENLTVDCTASYCQRGINYNDDGALKLNNVTVKGTNVTYALNLPGSSDKCEVAINNSSLTGNIALNVWGENSVITATNSEFVSVDKSTAEGYVAISLNNDGAGNAATGSVVTINGGKIIARDDKGEPSTAVRVETVATVNVSEETEVVGSIKRDVAIVTYEGSTDFYSFDNLQSAINKAIESKGTVVLLADVTIDELVKIEKDITIDLNGKKVTSTAKKAFEVYANTTIRNGTIEAAQRCVDTRKTVKLTLENVNLVADNYTTAYGNPQPLTIGGSENGTKVTMTNVNISAAAGYGIITFVETELTATNSTIGGYSALYVKPGSDNSVFNFVDSDLSGSTVGNDVEGNSFSVIAVRANNVTVNVDAASTVTAAGNYSYAISFKSSYQNEVATGSNVTVAGEITGNILADLNGNTVKVKAKYADKLAAAGYATIEAENGLVAVIEAVAKIGDKYFTTLEDALAAEGNKVELLVPYVVADDDEIVLDLKGKTVTGTPSEAKAYSAITNNGNLTIINGTLLCNHTLTGSTGYAVNTITNSGILTIDGATIQNTSTASNQIGYAIDNNSTSTNAIVTIKSGNVVASGSNYYDGIRQFCNSLTKDNSVIVKGGEVSSIWMQNPSDGAEKNTKDVKGSISISGGTVNILSLEPSTNFQAAVTGGYVGEISYFQEAEGRNLVKFITGGTFGMDVTKFCADYHNCTSNENGVYEVKPDANYIAEYIIDDAKGEDYTSAEEKVVGTLTYKRTLPNKMKWNPLYVPFAIPMSELIDNYDVAYFNDVRGNDADNDNVVDDGTLKMELVMIDNPDVTLNANYPFVFRAKTEEAKNLELVLDNATLYANTENSVVFTSLDIKCEVKGSYSKCKTGDKQYIVNTNGLWSPLEKLYELNPYRLILTLSSNDQLKPFGARDIRMFVIGEEDEDGTTHIFDVENEAQTQDCIYDLQGRRVLTPQKGGLYIVNGKKTVIR